MTSNGHVDAEGSVSNAADEVSVENGVHNDILSAVPIASTNDAKTVQQPLADMANEECSAESTQQPHSSLDLMTVEVVSLFQQGYKQEALDATVAFALNARNELGAKNPIYINALATAAALIDQMGGQLEADALLMEAEDLQEQMELDAFEAEHEPQGFVDGNGDESRWHNIRDFAETGEDPDASVAVNRTGEAVKSKARGTDGLLLNARPRKGGEANDAGGDDPRDGAASSNDSFDRYPPSSVSDSGDDGDAEVDMDDDSGQGEHSEDDDEEAEAEAITRLTWEVNSQLRQGRAEEAAQLLAEAESVLVGDDGGARLSGVTRAALHTLWATVLDAVGEVEKAQCLYDEAIECLAEEVGAATSASSSDEEASEDGDLESQDAESVDDAGGAPPPPSDGGEAEDQAEEATQDKKRTGDDAGPAFFITDGLGDDADEGPPSKTSQPVKPNLVAPKAQEHEAIAPDAQIDKAMVPDVDEDRPAALDAGEKEASEDAEVKPSESPILEVPTNEGAPSPSRPKGPKGVGRPGARGRALAPPEPAKRTGGGFAATAAPRSAAPKSKAKAKAKAKTKKKATENNAVEADVDEESPDSEGETAVPPVDVALDARTDEPEQAKCDDAGDALTQARSPPQDQLAAVSRAMKCADHFMGLMNFEKAADKLEEQLVELGSEDSPHRGSDLHVDVYMKYAGVLWWDCDPESAIDAYTAADELLRERPEGPAMRRRRANIRLQLAQVCRGCGDLEAADSHLSDVVHVLSELSAEPSANPSTEASAQVEGSKGSGSLDEALREAQAALAQVCVQRKEFRRAEKLYMKAFRESDSKQETGAEQEACDTN